MGNMGMGFKFQMGMGMKSLKWEGIGTKNLFPHTSTVQSSNNRKHHAGMQSKPLMSAAKTATKPSPSPHVTIFITAFAVITSEAFTGWRGLNGRGHRIRYEMLFNVRIF